MIRFLQGIASRLRVIFYKTRGVRFGGACWLRAVEIPRGHSGIALGDGVALDRGTTLLITGEGRIRIGARTYINRNAMLDASAEIEIGEDCMIGPFCYLTDHDHDATNPANGPLIHAPVRLGKGTWLGAHVTVLKGVTIGDGTIVGAGSVVTKPLPARVVAVGNPARIVRELGA